MDLLNALHVLLPRIPPRIYQHCLERGRSNLRFIAIFETF